MRVAFCVQRQRGKRSRCFVQTRMFALRASTTLRMAATNHISAALPHVRRFVTAAPAAAAVGSSPLARSQQRKAPNAKPQPNTNPAAAAIAPSVDGTNAKPNTATGDGAKHKSKYQPPARRPTPKPVTPTEAERVLSHVNPTTNEPTMVDVSSKIVTARTATARAVIYFPPHVATKLFGAAQSQSNSAPPPTPPRAPPAPPSDPSAASSEATTITGAMAALNLIPGSGADAATQRAVRNAASAKGPILATAIVAGTMAVKQTSNMIPFCHPLPIEGIKFAYDYKRLGDGQGRLCLDCTVKATHKTGVEMEALTGASVAALTLYDMCKALSHDIRFVIQLESKFGGKSDIRPKPAAAAAATTTTAASDNSTNANTSA